MKCPCGCEFQKMNTDFNKSYNTYSCAHNGAGKIFININEKASFNIRFRGMPTAILRVYNDSLIDYKLIIEHENQFYILTGANSNNIELGESLTSCYLFGNSSNHYDRKQIFKIKKYFKLTLDNYEDDYLKLMEKISKLLIFV